MLRLCHLLTIMLVFVPHQIVADTDLIDKLIIEREKHKELMSIASSPNPITNVGAKTWREDTLVISNGESYVVPDDVHMLAVKTLKMQDSSSLIIPPRMTRFTLKARFVVIGNNVTIASFGKDAIGHQRNGAGNHGGDAADFYLDFGSIDIRELSIISKGGAGAEGRHGVDGSDGIRARCLKRRYAKRGGDGEAGKKGGNSGSSGKVYIGWDENAQTSGSLNISVSTLGGAPGAGGQGGSGGKPAQGSGKCGVWPFHYKFGGAPGGEDGAEGPEGDVGMHHEVVYYHP